MGHWRDGWSLTTTAAVATSNKSCAYPKDTQDEDTAGCEVHNTPLA